MYQDNHSAHIVFNNKERGDCLCPEKNRFSKPVAFNHKNVKDQEILNHVKRRNSCVEPEPVHAIKNDVPTTMAEKLKDLKIFGFFAP